MMYVVIMIQPTWTTNTADILFRLFEEEEEALIVKLGGHP